uniref:Glyco_hydro_3 domain-containing protein n=1 Tax=Gongylonema pulchrum TaxID=637853 RepID=A0A183F0G2_9BILA
LRKYNTPLDYVVDSFLTPQSSAANNMKLLQRLEPAVLLMTAFQVVDDFMDIRSIGKKRWWQVLLSNWPQSFLR